MKNDFALVVPMANESKEFHPFINSLTKVLNQLEAGSVYLVVDKASRDNTLELCQNLSGSDSRFITVWAPENRNVVDAYIRGYKEALKNNHPYIIEMDAGLSHDPESLPLFLTALQKGYDCVFGSRFIQGGSIADSTWNRRFLSKGGTLLANLLLGTRLHDMTSGYQGFKSAVARMFANYPLLSRGHFYQTELRYLLRKTKSIEVPIHYRAPSPNVSVKSILNSFSVLFHYFLLRLKQKAAAIE